MNILPHVPFPYLKLRLSPIENARQYDINGTLAKSKCKQQQTRLPGMAIGEYGFIAHFEDSKGNRVAQHSEK